MSASLLLGLCQVVARIMVTDLGDAEHRAHRGTVPEQSVQSLVQAFLLGTSRGQLP